MLAAEDRWCHPSSDGYATRRPDRPRPRGGDDRLRPANAPGSLPRADGRRRVARVGRPQRTGRDGLSRRPGARGAGRRSVGPAGAATPPKGGAHRQAGRGLGVRARDGLDARPSRGTAWRRRDRGARGAERRRSVSRTGGGHVPAKRGNLFAQLAVLQLLLPRARGGRRPSPLHRRRRPRLPGPLTFGHRQGPGGERSATPPSCSPGCRPGATATAR